MGALSMCPEELIFLVTSIATVIAREQPKELVAVYADVFTLLGDTLAAYLSQCEFLENKCEK